MANPASSMSLLSGRESDSKDFITPRVLRARVSKVNSITGGTGSTTLQPTMTFEVIPDGGNPTASTDGVIKDVIMLQAGFSSLSVTDSSPGGIVYIPEVGSQVLIMHDGRRWVILGFYTGPCQTARENAKDPEGQRISFNPGIELPMSRMNLQPGLDNTPHWAFVAESGDAIMSKGDARVKVNGLGAIIGANAMCWSIYKSDGLTLERSVMREHRMAGYHFKHFFSPGLDANAIATAPPGSLAVPNPGAYFYQAEVLDLAPDPLLLKPYYLRQRGHVGGFDYYTGHQSGLSLNSTYNVANEYASKVYSVIRDAIVQPLKPVGGLAPGVELFPGLASSAEVYDYQVDANGSFRLRAGNKGVVPGGQSQFPTYQMDLSIEYSALLGEYSIRLGPAGSPAALVKIAGFSAATSKVSVLCKDLEATLTGGATIRAATGVSIMCPAGISLFGPLKVYGTITALGQITAPNAMIGGVNFLAHVHSYIAPLLPASAAPTSPPR
ncbi:MAG: hypothetical protein WC869_00465 [Phycisphaerae bacterium]|jgi:hypothetical protein